MSPTRTILMVSLESVLYQDLLRKAARFCSESGITPPTIEGCVEHYLSHLITLEERIRKAKDPKENPRG